MAISGSDEIDIKATPAAVMATLEDFASYPEWSSAHKKASVETTDDAGRPQRVRMTMQMVGITDEQVVDYSFDGNEKMSWSLVESSQQKSQEGTYTLTDNGDGTTHVTFELALDIKIKVPGFLLNKAKKGALETATKSLKKRVESQA
ncbi:SRPBCC family protein [Rhodococcus sp. X156]|uniref:SRPBCC family protein n=1 Tax=Rhodococcus sp. X156 TaxID=2499145 RepID=UPI000FDACD74|nr:SRPBCC family protein [Rhodococcus sp. X156]